MKISQLPEAEEVVVELGERTGDVENLKRASNRIKGVWMLFLIQLQEGPSISSCCGKLFPRTMLDGSQKRLFTKVMWDGILLTKSYQPSLKEKFKLHQRQQSHAN